VTVNTQEQRVDALASQAKSIIDKAELEGRGRTADEDLEVAELMKKIGMLRARIAGSAAIAEVGRQIGVTDSELAIDPGAQLGSRVGDAFVKSEGYKRTPQPVARGGPRDRSRSRRPCSKVGSAALVRVGRWSRPTFAPASCRPCSSR
jgi:hypothetical protein